MSPCPDEKAIGVDTLHCLWPSRILYAFLTDVHFTRRNQQNAIRSPVQDSDSPALVTARQVDPGPELSSVSVRAPVSPHSGVSASAAQGLRTSGSASVESTVVVPREDRMRQIGFSD